MAKRRTWKRDKNGRFASTSGGSSSGGSGPKRKSSGARARARRVVEHPATRQIGRAVVLGAAAGALEYKTGPRSPTRNKARATAGRRRVNTATRMGFKVARAQRNRKRTKVVFAGGLGTAHR